MTVETLLQIGFIVAVAAVAAVTISTVVIEILDRAHLCYNPKREQIGHASDDLTPASPGPHRRLLNVEQSPDLSDAIALAIQSPPQRELEPLRKRVEARQSLFIEGIQR